MTTRFDEKYQNLLKFYSHFYNKIQMCKFKIENADRSREKDIKNLFLNEILMHDLTSSDLMELMLTATQKGTKDQEN